MYQGRPYEKFLTWCHNIITIYAVTFSVTTSTFIILFSFFIMHVIFFHINTDYVRNSYELLIASVAPYAPRWPSSRCTKACRTPHGGLRRAVRSTMASVEQYAPRWPPSSRTPHDGLRRAARPTMASVELYAPRSKTLYI